MPPTACFTPTIPGIRARARSVRQPRVTPVRYGMLYTISGTGLTAASRRKWARMPSGDGRVK
jgi:hypothetical protein